MEITLAATVVRVVLPAATVAVRRSTYVRMRL
jgi:hypothetical protein